MDILIDNVSFEKGHVYTILGRSCMGKTTVAKRLAESFSAKGFNVLYIYAGDIFLREICAVTFGHADMGFDFEMNCLWQYGNYVILRQFDDYVDYMSAIPDVVDICIIDSFQYLKVYLSEEGKKGKFLLDIAKKKNISIIVTSHVPRSVEYKKRQGSLFERHEKKDVP